MAAITSAAVGAVGLGMSAYQAIDGANRQKKAQRELNNYERQELNNAFENVQISTMGSDLLREEGARTTANLVDATQMGGARTIIGGIPRVVGASNEINREAAKMLDDQVQNREYAIAGDNTRIEGITENRDIANIAGLSSQINAGRQDMWSGFGSALSSAAYMGRGLKEMKGTNNVAPSTIATQEIGNNVVSGINKATNIGGNVLSAVNKSMIPASNFGSNNFLENELYGGDLINKYGQNKNIF